MRARLDGSVELLDRALSYTCAQLAGVRQELLGRTTPCEAWTLADLLAHLEDALDAFTEAAGGSVEVRACREPSGAVPSLRAKATALLDAWSRPTPGDVVIEAPGSRLDLDTPLLVSTAALEVTVHGWDVGQATGRAARVPETLAAELLPVATCLVRPGDRGVRFVAPRRVAADAPYDVALLAFLGRT